MRNEITIKISSETLTPSELNWVGMSVFESLEYAEKIYEVEVKHGNNDKKKYYKPLHKLLEEDKTYKVTLSGPVEIKEDK